MVAVVLLAAVLVVVLLIALAVFGRNPSVFEAQRAERRLARGGGRAGERISPNRLRALVHELLEAMGLEVLAEGASTSSGSLQRLTAVQPGPFRDVRHAVFIDPAPPGDLVEATTVLELAEQVKAEESGGVGLLITPYAIDRGGIAGLDANVQLVDGARLRELVARHLPHRLPELANYRLGRLGGRERPPRAVVPDEHHAASRA